MYGCDKFCTYCIVPMTRGKIRSRQKQDIIDEVNQMIKDGYKEVTLIGPNTKKIPTVVIITTSAILNIMSTNPGIHDLTHLLAT